ncbi:MAG TPA: hypothetical protein PLV68_07615, partial [Ilumatobacteraceae bacterium]|nr:hypothetical protein [Ilumatobacteraceae bacterium]
MSGKETLAAGNTSGYNNQPIAGTRQRTSGEYVSEQGRTTGSDDVIVLQHVRKQFANFTAVHDANFSIRRGEFFSMLGPSGCG